MDHEGWIARYGRAWHDKNADAVTELFTEDCVYRSSPSEAPHVGKEALVAYWRRATATQRELDLRFGVPVVDGCRMTVEWWALIRDPDWRPGASTDWVTLPGCLVLTFTPDGRCAELREYYNPVVGAAIPAPSGWGE
jgi:hypothetical protein